MRAQGSTRRESVEEPPAGESLASVDEWDKHWTDFARAAELNPAQRYRRARILALLGCSGSPQRLIDIGSGQGDLLRAASRRWPAASLLGLEMSEQGNEIARTKVPAADFICVDLAGDVPKPQRFAGWATDAVCSEVLEHVDDPAAVLRAARVYLAPGARVVVTVPGGPMSAFDRRIGHRRHFTRHDLAAVFEEAGMDTETVSGAGFPFFNIYRRVVIARGDALGDELVARDGAPTIPARVAMLAFRPLLALSLPTSPWGTQIIGVAKEPSAG